MRNSRHAEYDPGLLRTLVHPLTGDRSDFDRIVRAASGKRFVLLGEATHGTHEFYRVRAEITKRLIRDCGFSAVAAEGDWPDAYRLHRYVQGRGTDREAFEALGGFKRFPVWMWRNADVLDFAGWLRAHNDTKPEREKAGFYGLDLYSLYASIEAVVRYLEKVDAAAAERARERYGCFDRFGPDMESYAYTAGAGLTASCETEVLQQLLEIQRHDFGELDTRGDDGHFFAEQNARVVASAERYYRTMISAEVSSWNLRDRFMFETLERLSDFLETRREQAPKIVVWAHNSHVGDARATSLGAGREINIGQLVRERYPSECRLVGFTTSSGTVTAASRWDAAGERKNVKQPLPGSWESLFHSIGIANFHMELASAAAAHPPLGGRLLERAIGVIYRPQSELYSHYFEARIAGQFDDVLHYDRTRAVEPLERTSLWEAGEIPETYPSGI
ncbi:MAG TPA: erythromycin esterase family protein [Candidatus Baltobacteraceae bacterium]|jgi:erythromycin esterase-like protein|nr:erythromycin esterase family protein [Candidatus Baltobacteraceae bacterium]